MDTGLNGRLESIVYEQNKQEKKYDGSEENELKGVSFVRPASSPRSRSRE